MVGKILELFFCFWSFFYFSSHHFPGKWHIMLNIMYQKTSKCTKNIIFGFRMTRWSFSYVICRFWNFDELKFIFGDVKSIYSDVKSIFRSNILNLEVWITVRFKKSHISRIWGRKSLLAKKKVTIHNINIRILCSSLFRCEASRWYSTELTSEKLTTGQLSWPVPPRLPVWKFRRVLTSSKVKSPNRFDETARKCLVCG